jgi:NitT/TauT family transport system ATP-binding protein
MSSLPMEAFFMTAETPAAFELSGLGIRFPGAERSVIDDFSLTIHTGEFLSVVGPSGCGKSTLLRLLAGLTEPSAGTIRRASANGARHRTGFVFQHPTLLPWRTAEANLQLPMELGRSHAVRPLSSSECEDLLRQVGLTASDARKRPAELSGGMQMRLSLARALATKPDVLLLDEPFAAVDDLLRLKLQEDVRRLHDQRQLTSILVTHNLHEAVFLSDRVIVMSGSPATLVQSIPITTRMSRSAAFRDSPEFFDFLRTVSTALFRTPAVAPPIH